MIRVSRAPRPGAATHGRARERFAGWLLGAACVTLLSAARATAAPNDITTSGAGNAATASPVIAILCYHDLSDQTGRELQTVSPAFLRGQIRACRQAGWTFLALSELLALRDRPEALPRRVMVLTFDDGYKSFFDQALPILKAEGVKATLGIITAFVDHPPAGMPPLMTWDDIRAADRSGWVEIASHSHDLHRYGVDNPYGDTAPALATRLWLGTSNRYESREEYRARVRADLAESQRVLSVQLGHPTTTLVWPYGAHNAMARGLATQIGFTNTLALGWHEVQPADLALNCLPRIMVTRTLRFAGGSLAWLRAPRGVLRAARLRPQDLWDGDLATYRKRLDATIARLRAAGATHVLLDATARDPDGTIEQSWFPSHQTATRADLWSLTAARLANARFEVWAVAPTQALGWAWRAHPEWRLSHDPHMIATIAAHAAPATRGERHAARWAERLSPELTGVRQAAADFLTDLAVYVPLEGVVFDDDAAVSPGEALASNPSANAAARATALAGLETTVKDAVRAWRPECRFAHAIDTGTLEADGVDAETAQNTARWVTEGDLVVVRADARDPAFVRDPAHTLDAAGRAATRLWRSEQRTRARAAGDAGLPPAVLDVVSPFVIELPATLEGSGALAYTARLPAWFAFARRAGFESFALGPVTPDNAKSIPDRALEATAR